MLALDSSEWKNLSHAYGNAADVPELLKQLKTAPSPEDTESEPWFSLWSSLCHQSDVYTASYATLPHIAAIAATKSAKERLDLLHFIASVEVYRHKKKSPALPAFLQQDYCVAIEQAATLTIECLVEHWEEKELAVLLGAVAVFRGQVRLGSAMMEMPEEPFCPKCESAVSTPGYDLGD